MTAAGVTPVAAGVRVQRYGDLALLVDLPDLDAVRALDAALRSDRPPGTLDVVPAARTVLVRFAPGTSADAVERHVRAVCTVVLGRARDHGPAGDAWAAGGSSGAVVLGVHYDGADLDEVAAVTGLTRAEVVARHTAREYVAAFGGFVPGFAYLTGLDPALHVPRRDRPRERVPAGSVAVAGEYAAVYPAATPGGWRLLGRTDAVLFDAGRERPALLVPGSRVRFVDLDAPASDSAPGFSAPAGEGSPDGRADLSSARVPRDGGR